MHADSLKAFNKISFEKKNILKLKGEVLKLQNAFESLKEDHAFLVNDQLCITITLDEKGNLS